MTMSPAPLVPHKLLELRSKPGEKSGSEQTPLARYGIYHTKLEFFQKSLEVSHRFDNFSVVDELAKQNVYHHIATCRERLKTLMDIEQRARSMDQQERQWKATLPKHMQEVLTGKRVLLWEQLLKEQGYQDMAVINFMKNGVDLVGEHEPSPLLPSQMLRAATSPGLLAKSSVWRNHSFASAAIHQDEPDMTKILYEVTLDEVKRGFLKGPYLSLQSIKEQYGLSHVVVNRRFLLLQGDANKPRAIDDCKTSGLNNAYTQNNKLVLQDLDCYMWPWLLLRAQQCKAVKFVCSFMEASVFSNPCIQTIMVR